MTIEDIIDDIKNSDNIFDVFINIYNTMDKIEGKILKSITGRNEEKFVSYSLDLKKYFENDGFIINLTNNNKNTLINFINKSKSDDELFLKTFALFKEIDKTFGDNDILNSKNSKSVGRGGLSLTGKKVDIIKPLNSDITYSKGYVYNFGPNSVLNHNKNKYRHQNKVPASLEGCFKNIFVYKIGDRKDYEMKLNYLTSQSFYRKLEKYKNKLKIAIIPFVNDSDYLVLNEEKKTQGFYVEKIKFEDNYIQKLIKIAKELNEKEVNIVVFPEMVMTEKMIEELKNFLKENTNSFLIIVSGTVWKDGINYCKVMIGDGKEIVNQKKCGPFHADENWDILGSVELLNSYERIINLIDIKDFGRCAVAICVDYITEYYHKILEDMKTSMIFNPTYTKSISRFEDFSKIFTSFNTATLMANACCMRNIDPKKNVEIPISFIDIPGLEREKFFKCKECSDLCNKDTKSSCYFIIDFPYKDGNSNEQYCNVKKIMIKYD